jgi:hypothetical protein
MTNDTYISCSAALLDPLSLMLLICGEAGFGPEVKTWIRIGVDVDGFASVASACGFTPTLQ